MNKFYRVVSIFLFTLPLFFTTGCLTTEYKEYRFTLNDDGSGEGSIIFYNIVSVEDDNQDVSIKDYDELISDYLNGNRFELDNPNYKVTDKELYEDNGVLSGKITFSFSNIDSIGFFRYDKCDCSPLIYYLGDFGETLVESNGTTLIESKNIPIILWDNESTDIYFKTTVQDNLEQAHSLLTLYNQAKESE